MTQSFSIFLYIFKAILILSLQSFEMETFLPTKRKRSWGKNRNQLRKEAVEMTHLPGEEARGKLRLESPNLNLIPNFQSNYTGECQELVGLDF